MKTRNRVFAKKTVKIGAAMLLASYSLISAHAEMDVKANIGIGYDTNIYKAPSTSYLDYYPIPQNTGSILDAVPVTPRIHHGMFLPYDINIEGRKLTAPDVYFIGGYRLKGYRYFDPDYSNANRNDHKFNIGARGLINKSGVKEEYVEGNILFGHQRRLYLDRDYGDNHTLTSNPLSGDVATRYIYDYTGLELSYKDRVSSLQKLASLHIEKRDYYDVPGINETQYDNTYTAIKFGIDKKLTKPMKLGVDYKYYTYDFVERKAKNSNGRLVTGTTRKYTYNQLKFTLRYRMSKAWLHTGTLEYKTRKDDYVGYDDYTKIGAGIRTQWDSADKMNRVKGAYTWWKRDYPNAYAFDNGKFYTEQKKYDGTTLELAYIRKLSEQLDLNCNYQRIDENTTDTRYQYLRSLYQVGVEYQF